MENPVFQKAPRTEGYFIGQLTPGAEEVYLLTCGTWVLVLDPFLSSKKTVVTCID